MSACRLYQIAKKCHVNVANRLNPDGAQGGGGGA